MDPTTTTHLTAFLAGAAVTVAVGLLLGLSTRSAQKAAANRHTACLLTIARTPAADWPDALHTLTRAAAGGARVDRAGAWLVDDAAHVLRCESLYVRSVGRHEPADPIPLTQFADYFESLAASFNLAVADIYADPGRPRSRRRTTPRPGFGQRSKSPSGSTAKSSAWSAWSTPAAGPGLRPTPSSVRRWRTRSRF